MNILCYCNSHFISHSSCSLISNPTMDTSTTRKDPKECFESKILCQCVIQNLRSTRHIAPTLLANFCTFTTCSHIVIVSHINIENHFFLDWNENLFLSRQMILRRDIENSSNIYFMRCPRYQCFLKFLWSLKAEISTVDVILKCERELTVVELFWEDLSVLETQKHSCGRCIPQFEVAQPFKHQVIWECFIVIYLQQVNVKVHFDWFLLFFRRLYLILLLWWSYFVYFH
jgi:hypothetical protein